MERFQGVVISAGRYRTMGGTAEDGFDIEISGPHFGVQVRGYVYDLDNDLDVFDINLTSALGKTYLGSAIRDKQGNVFFTRDMGASDGNQT